MVLAAAVLTIAAAVPATAPAEVWTITPSIVNDTGNTVANCPSYAPGNNCIFVQGTASLSSDGVWSDGSDHPSNTPWNAIAAAFGTWNGTDTWAYYAPYFGYGADAYVTYVMPDGSVYYVTIEDDLDGSIGSAGANMYAACVAGQASSAYVCTPNSGNYEASDFDPSITFTPPGDAPTLAAGQVCAGTVAGGQSIDCTGTGQFSGPIGTTVVWFANPGPNGATITDTTTGQSCSVDPMPSSGDFEVCALQTGGNDNDAIAISPSSPGASSVDLQVQVYALAPVSSFAGAFSSLLNDLWGSVGAGGGDDVVTSTSRALRATPTDDPRVFRVGYPTRPLTPPKGRRHVKPVKPPESVSRRITRAYTSPPSRRPAG